MVKRPQILEMSRAVKGKILCFLHYRYAHSEDVVFTIGEISDVIKGSNGRIISFALEELHEEDLVEREFIVEAPGSDPVAGYSITRTAIRIVESWDEESYEIASEGIDFLDPLDADDSAEPSGGEKGLNEWEPLPLERSSEEYKAAVKSVESALDEIEGNNGYASAEPEERNQIIWSIKDGLNQIKDGLPNREQVTTMLLKPLRYIARKFADASMGEVAKTAIKALLSWLLP